MSSEPQFDLYGQATLWADHLRTDPSFTNSDAEELKGHLLDIAEELVSQGLSEEEAFVVASSRLGEPMDLKDEFEEINTPVIQLRKTILVLSGILAFFLFYFFVVSSARFLVLALDHFSDNYVLNFRFVFSYVFIYLLFIIVSTVMLYYSSLKRIKRFEYWKIKPAHTFLLFSGTFILALINIWLTRVINQSFNHTSYTFYHQYTLFDYLNYLLPLISIICFIVLYKKHNRSARPDDENSESNEVRTMNSILFVFSGILVYFSLHFFLHSSARILISALQYFVNDPGLNIRRTWSFVISFQLLFILFTAALYFLDRNIVQRIKDLHIKPGHTLWLLISILFLAILDRCFFPIAVNMIGQRHSDLIYKYSDIFIVSDFCFPFVLGACFLILFSKYYRDHIKIGN